MEILTCKLKKSYYDKPKSQTEICWLTGWSVVLGLTLLHSNGQSSNPIALRMAKTLWSFGHSECKRVNDQLNFEGVAGSIVDNTVDYQSRDHKIGPPLLRFFR